MIGKGLSPRLRGNHLRAPCRSLGTVYPRACGGTGSFGFIDEVHTGLSPRLRGNLEQRGLDQEVLRSIPAPAGEPAPCAHSASSQRVYPRACGGTVVLIGASFIVWGLSPRLRGNPGVGGGDGGRGRSIPAPAGEPYSGAPRAALTPVYPRACGGTYLLTLWSCPNNGLSPRLRGNL